MRNRDLAPASVQLAEHLGQEARRLALIMRLLQACPHGRKRRAEIAQQIGQHLAQRLWLARELGQVMTITDRALAAAFARMCDAHAVATDDRDGVRADVHEQVEPRPRAPS